MKFCLPGAAPVGEETRLREIKAMVEAGDSRPPASPGRVEHVDLLDAFARARPLVRRRRRRCGRSRSSPTPRTGWAASSSRRCSSGSRSRCTTSSASSTARSRTTPPIRSSPRTSTTSSARCSSSSADIGLAFDGDADRVFLVDDQGQAVSGSTTTAIVATAMLAREPGRDDRAQPHLLEDRARGRSASTAASRSARASVTRSSSR